MGMMTRESYVAYCMHLRDRFLMDALTKLKGTPPAAKLVAIELMEANNNEHIMQFGSDQLKSTQIMNILCSLEETN